MKLVFFSRKGFLGIDVTEKEVSTGSNQTLTSFENVFFPISISILKLMKTEQHDDEHVTSGMDLLRLFMRKNGIEIKKEGRKKAEKEGSE